MKISHASLIRHGLTALAAPLHSFAGVLKAAVSTPPAAGKPPVPQSSAMAPAARSAGRANVLSGKPARARLIVAAAGMLAVSGAFAQTVVIAPTAPPPPRVEVVPPARAGYVWAPGHWRWDHGRYVWATGHWRAMRVGYRWVPGGWAGYGRRWHWRPGHWVR